MLTVAVVIIAVILVLANLDILLSLAVTAFIFALGLAAIVAVIALLAEWPMQVMLIILLCVGIFCIFEWDENRIAKKDK